MVQFTPLLLIFQPVGQVHELRQLVRLPVRDPQKIPSSERAHRRMLVDEVT
jgi:hypothetical protein